LPLRQEAFAFGFGCLLCLLFLDESLGFLEIGVIGIPVFALGLTCNLAPATEAVSRGPGAIRMPVLALVSLSGGGGSAASTASASATASSATAAIAAASERVASTCPTIQSFTGLGRVQLVAVFELGEHGDEGGFGLGKVASRSVDAHGVVDFRFDKRTEVDDCGDELVCKCYVGTWHFRGQEPPDG
jgi:hypothetical protein